ncbi:MmpL_efflux pump [Hexamita inflata]|uniref:Putative n=1 Tax=Hexamita inflata TaxID=28002 RepID=A0AA86PYD0_9EUKA|nr:MmpL efflux pump [Hexamita inflata]
MHQQKSKVFQGIIDCKYVVFIIWLGVSLGLVKFALQYESVTSMYFAPPSGSASAKGVEFVNATFPSLTKTETVVVMVNDVKKQYYEKGELLCNNSHTQVKSKLIDFTKDVKNIMENDYSEFFLKTEDYYTTHSQYDNILNYQVKLLGQQERPFAETEKAAARMFCKESAMIIQGVFDASWEGQKITADMKKDFQKSADSKLADLGLEVSILSTSNLNEDMASGTMKDVLKLDSFSIVLGLIVVALFIKNIKLMIITIINLAFAFAVSFGISYFIATSIDVASFSSAVQSSCMVALAFDYSLFLFTRVKTEISMGSNPEQVIHNMLKYSGRVVLVSGFCLAVTFILLMVCPVKMVKSIGLCSFISICCIVFSCITNSAAMLAIFPKFFIGEKFDFWRTDYLNPKRRANLRQEVVEEKQQQVEAPKQLSKCAQVCTVQKNVPLKVGKFETCIVKTLTKTISKKWVSALCCLAVCAISLPFLAPMVNMKHSINLAQLIPRSSKTLKAINEFGDAFGSGLISPFYVIFTKKGTNYYTCTTAECNNSFDVMGNMAQEFIDASQTTFSAKEDKYLQLDHTKVIAPFYPGQKLSLEHFQQLLYVKDPSLKFAVLQTSPQSTVPLPLSTFALMITPEVPMTAGGSDKFVPFYRDIITKYEKIFRETYGITISEYGRNNAMIDAVDMLFEKFIMVFGISFAAVFVILMVAFRSFFAPIRLIIEVALIYIFFFGVNTLIFQYGHVHDDDALHWGTIFIMCSLSLGLACDYDIFSFNGVYTHFNDHYKAAIKAGAELSFKDCVIASYDNVLTVMTAGLIMIISFCGLLLSSLDLLLQFGCCLVVGLAFDTFVVVPIIVPGLSFIFGTVNLFPGNIILHKKVLKEMAAEKAANASNADAGVVPEDKKEEKNSEDRAEIVVATEENVVTVELPQEIPAPQE